MMIHWWKYRRKLSAFADMALDRAEHSSVWRHAQRCSDCREELYQISGLGEELRALPAPVPPADLALRIRSRISQERAQAQRAPWWWRLANDWGSYAVPACSGLLSAAIIFGLIVPAFSVPVRADGKDTLLSFNTPPRLRILPPLPTSSDPGHLVVQVLVDQQGRVADYAIISGTYTEVDLRDLRNQLVFTVFDPAMQFGVPTAEHMILSFSRVRVRA